MNSETITTPQIALEAERNVIGSALMDRDMFLEARELITSEDFYAERHRVIWQHLERLSAAGQPLDLDLLMISLRDSSQLDDIGGAMYLLGLVNETMISLHAKAYAWRPQRGASFRRAANRSPRLKPRPEPAKP
jgi:replicative DNA helicase